MSYLLVLLICMLGGFAAGVTAFGYAIICMVLMSLFLSVKTATLVTLMTCFPLYLAILYPAVIKMKVRLDLRMIAAPLFGSAIGRYLGILAFEAMNGRVLMITLCVFMTLLNVYFFFFSERFHLKPTSTNGVSAGLVSGFFASLNNVGGPPLVAYMYSVEEDRYKYTAYLQIIFMLGAFISVYMHLQAGNITEQVMQLSAYGLVGVGTGAAVGFRLFRILDSKRLTLVIKYFILFSSAVLVIKTYIDFF